MRLLGFLVGLALWLIGGVALAQHGSHHGGGSQGGSTTMECCTASSDMCDPSAECMNADGTCDMSKCCDKMKEGGSGMSCGMSGMSGMGGMSGGMGGMSGGMGGGHMKDHHSGSGMGEMMCCGDKCKCCKKKDKEPSRTAPKPTLK